MAGPSRARGKTRAGRGRSSGDTFTRGRLLIGLLLITLVGAGAAFFLRRSAPGPDPGTLVYAGAQGVYVHDLDSGHDRRVATLPSGTIAAIPSPDGKWVAYSLGAGELWLASLEGERRFQVGEQLVLPLGWSPDGRLLASELGSDHDLVAVDPEGGREVLASGTFPPISTPVWLDDHRFAIATTEKAFVIIDTTQSSPPAPIAGTPLAASPDGAELLLAREGAVMVSKVESDEPVGLRVIFRGEAKHAAASSEGFLAIAAKDFNGKEGAWIFEGGTKSQKVASGVVGGLSWSVRGAALIYQQKGALYALERPGAEPKRVSRKGVAVFSLLSFTVVR